MTRAERERINAQALATDHLLDGLGARTTGGVAISLGAQMFSMLLQVGYTAALARLLRPSDFGVAALAMAVTGLAALFTEAGLSTASVQRKELDQNLVSALFTANVVLGLLAMLFCFLLAYPAALLFHDPRVTWAVVAFGATIPVAATAVQHQALLQRQMRQGALQSITVAATVIGFAAGLAVAWLGGGFWALVAAAAATAVGRMLLAWVICSWRPSRVTDWSEVRGAINFGAYLTGFNFTLFLARQADVALIGAVWGTTTAGYYSRAYQLMLLPINAINGPLGSVFLPALSRLQADARRWRDTFLRTYLTASVIGCLAAAILMVTADKVVLLVYGPGWQETAAIFRWLSASMLLIFPMSAMAWAFVSLGNTKAMFQWGVIQLLVLLAVFACTVRFGALTLAVGYSLSFVVLTPVIYYLALRSSPLSPIHALREIAPLWIAAVCGVAAGALVRHLPLGFLAGLVLETAATVAMFSAVLVLLVRRRPDWARLPADLLGLVRTVLGRGRLP